MLLAEWEAKGWLQKCRADKEVVQKLLQDAESDLRDARRDLPHEWTFSLAASASFSLCTVILIYSGYDTEKDRDLKAVRALPFILGDERKAVAEYLEVCLKLRNSKLADSNNRITPDQTTILLKFTEDFYLETIEWLRNANSLLVANSDVSFLRQPEDSLLLL